MVSIYALIDPRDGSIRYIGSSRNPYYRLNGHLSEPTNINMKYWTRDLINNGLVPKVKVLSLENDVSAIFQETRMICRCLKAGLQLLNAKVPSKFRHMLSSYPYTIIKVSESGQLPSEILKNRSYWVISKEASVIVGCSTRSVTNNDTIRTIVFSRTKYYLRSDVEAYKVRKKYQKEEVK